MTPDASVILVSDYKAGEEKSWNDLRKTLRALASQRFDGTFEVRLIEEEKYLNAIPPDLATILPGLKIIASRAGNSYALGNFGVRTSEARIAILLDADSTPWPGWLAACVAALEADPKAAVVSGRSVYPGRTVTERCLGLLLRAYVEQGGAGPTAHISNNNAGYRREAYLEHPLPEDAGVFSSRVQAVAMARAGWRLLFEPGMTATHDYEGWQMERDARASMAHGMVLIRQRDPSLPHAWIVRLGVLGLPLFVAGHMVQGLGKCLTAARGYGVRPWEVPYAMLLALYVPILEIPGYMKALRGESITETVYR